LQQQQQQEIVQKRYPNLYHAGIPPRDHFGKKGDGSSSKDRRENKGMIHHVICMHVYAVFLQYIPTYLCVLKEVVVKTHDSGKTLTEKKCKREEKRQIPSEGGTFL
jgi:hypothetical protein